MGDLTATLAFTLGAVLFEIGISSGKTVYPRWFLIVSPLGTLIIAMVVARYVLVPFGTWLMLVPDIGRN